MEQGWKLHWDQISHCAAYHLHVWFHSIPRDSTADRNPVTDQIMSPNSTDPPESKDNSYSVFNAVDASVAKKVVGSDGAANWQAFRQETAGVQVRTSTVAPKAPLKALDRALGFTSWDDEVVLEQTSRKESGARALHSGYQHFQEKGSADVMTEKERRRIREKRLGPNQQYFIPAQTFQGWKWDYVFTTRAPRGIGYYFDGTDSLFELEGKRKRPIDNTTTTKDKEAPKKKKKKKKNTGVETVHDPNHPLEQVKALVRNKQEQSLPEGWETALDASTQRPYYFHRATGERRWDRPVTNEWNEAKDPTTGKTYYYHRTTGETTWDPPDGTTS